MSRGFTLLERAIRELARSRDLPARLASERLEPSSLLEELGLDSVGTIALLLEAAHRKPPPLPNVPNRYLQPKRGSPG